MARKIRAQIRAQSRAIQRPSAARPGKSEPRRIIDAFMTCSPKSRSTDRLPRSPGAGVSLADLRRHVCLDARDPRGAHEGIDRACGRPATPT